MQNSSLRPWIVVISAGLFFFYEFLQMTVFNSISEPLMQAFNIDGMKFGILAAGYFYANVIFLFPAGILLDRFSTRKLILCGLSLCIVGTIAMALAKDYYFALGARFVIGMASTLCFLSAARLASRWFPSQHLALAIGVVVTMAMLGGFVAQTPMTFLVSHVGWRVALLIDAVLGVVFLLVIFRNVFDYPENFKLEHASNLQQLQAMGFWPSIATSLANRQNWFAGLYTSFLNLSVFLIGSSFGSLYLQQVYHFTPTQASLCSSMIFIGTIIGSPVIGNLSDRWGLRRRPMIIFAALSLLTILLLLFLSNPSVWEMGLLILVLGVFTSAQIISYPLIAESNARALTSSATGMASVLIMGGGAVFEPLFGWLLNSKWDHTIVNGVAQYSVHDFDRALLILPITCFIALIIAFLIKEPSCRTMPLPSNPG